MTTEERLENLERELARAKRSNRWLTAVVGLVVLGLILAWTLTKPTPASQPQEAAKAMKPSERLLTDEEVLGQEAAKAPKPAQVVRATAFVLVDDKGRERGKLEMSKEGPGEGGPSLTLKDENSNIRVMLSMPPALDSEPSLVMYGERAKSNYCVLLSSGGLFLRDENGKLRAGLKVMGDSACLELNDANGKPPTFEDLVDTLEAGEVPLWDERGKRGVWLGVHRGGTTLQMNGENGACGAALFTDKNGARLNLSDESGRPRAGLSADQDGPRLILSDENGKTRVGLAAVNDGTLLGLLDENGKSRATLSLEKDGPVLGLFDENGNVRARLRETPAGASLALCDEKDEYRAELHGAKGGSSLSLGDVNKKAGAMLMMSPYGTWLSLFDKNGIRVSLNLDKDGPGLDLNDEDGKPIKSLP